MGCTLVLDLKSSLQCLFFQTNAQRTKMFSGLTYIYNISHQRKAGVITEDPYENEDMNLHAYLELYNSYQRVVKAHSNYSCTLNIYKIIL